jgi:SSS family solute:Na+ symporter
VTVTLALLLLYSALQIALGLWISRRVRSSKDFFVAGRGLSAGLIFSTFLAANIGAGSTVGATAEGYQYGFSAWWWNGAAGLGSLALAFWIAPRMWRAAKTHGDLTVGDFLERHYGRGMRGVVAALIWFGTLHILAAQLLGIAAVLQVAGGIPPAAGVIIGAFIAVAYFTAGGLLTTASVNRVQLIVKLVGFAIATPAVVALAGGVSRLVSADTTGFVGGGDATGWRYLFILAPAFMVSPGLLQKAFGARDETAVRQGIGLNAVAILLFAFAPPLLGISARLLYPELARPDLALPQLMTDALPAVVGALALAAVFSAELSAADAVMFMLATSASRDLYAGFVKRDASDERILAAARVFALAGAAAGVVLALFVHASVTGAIRVFYAILTVTLFVPVIGALHARASRPAGLAAVAAGVVTLIVVHFATEGRGYWIVTPTLAGILASLAAFAVAGTTFRPRATSL